MKVHTSRTIPHPAGPDPLEPRRSCKVAQRERLLRRQRGRRRWSRCTGALRLSSKKMLRSPCSSAERRNDPCSAMSDASILDFNVYSNLKQMLLLHYATIQGSFAVELAFINVKQIWHKVKLQTTLSLIISINITMSFDLLVCGATSPGKRSPVSGCHCAGFCVGNRGKYITMISLSCLLMKLFESKFGMRTRPRTIGRMAGRSAACE